MSIYNYYPLYIKDVSREMYLCRRYKDLVIDCLLFHDTPIINCYSYLFYLDKWCLYY